MKKVYIILLLIFIPFLGFNQNFGIGGSAMYNFQSETLGAGVRASIKPNNRLSFVPQFSKSLLSFGPVDIKEWTLGLGLELKIIQLNTFNFYILGHGGYNNWSNYDESTLIGAKSGNWNAEAGIGLTTNKCLRPFIEYRYNVKFQETHLQLGLLYIFGCGNNGGGYRNTSRMKKGVVCPAYN